MVPTMQPSTGAWNPETARSNGVNRQAEMFGNPATAGQPFVQTPTGAFIPNPFANVAVANPFITHPINAFGIPTINPMTAAICNNTIPTNNPFATMNPHATINPYATINPFATINPLATINPMFNPTIAGQYPTTNPFLATTTPVTTPTAINTLTTTTPTLGNTLTPIGATSLGTVLYRDTITGAICDPTLGICTPNTTGVNLLTACCTTTPNITTIPNMTTLPQTMMNNGIPTPTMIPNFAAMSNGIPCGIPCNTIPTIGINPWINTTNPWINTTPGIQTTPGINPLFTHTINPFAANTVTPFGINGTTTLNPFLNAMRNIANPFGTAAAIHGINNAWQTTPIWNNGFVANPIGINPLTIQNGLTPAGNICITPTGQVMTTPFGTINPWINGANIGTIGVNGYGIPTQMCATTPTYCGVC